MQANLTLILWAVEGPIEPPYFLNYQTLIFLWSFFAGKKELTDPMKNNLALRISQAGDLHLLGVNGFGLRGFIVDAALRNHNNDINGAALQVIKAWSDTLPRSEAYEKLYAIINKINKAAWLEVLE